MLLFDNQLFQLKTYVFKYLHNLERHRHHTAPLPSVPHQDGAELVFFQHTMAFSGDILHFFQKVLDF